jgi:hypothetical protein
LGDNSPQFCGGATPRVRVPRTAVQFVDLVDKRGLADLQRVFGCSKRAAKDLGLSRR